SRGTRCREGTGGRVPAHDASSRRASDIRFARRVMIAIGVDRFPAVARALTVLRVPCPAVGSRRRRAISPDGDTRRPDAALRFDNYALSGAPAMPEMVVLPAVEQIDPIAAPGTCGGRFTENAPQILFLMPATVEPPVPGVIVLTAIEDIHMAVCPGACSRG